MMTRLILGLLLVFVTMVHSDIVSEVMLGNKLAGSVQTADPIIGVLTTPMVASVCPPLNSTRSNDANYTSCFTSFYSKWLEQTGARVAVIPYDASPTELKTLFSQINGLLFTGGELTLATDSWYFQTALQLWQLAIDANDHGDYFPVWGTCMGFQLMSIMAANNNQTVLSHAIFDADNMSLPLDFTSSAASSRLFSALSNVDYTNLATWNITSNLHHDGILPHNFYSNPLLSKFFNVLSTNKDINGLEFISTIEAYDYPFYATQWHPERPQYEWRNCNINHTAPAIHAMQAIGAFFTQETRYNGHEFKSDIELENALIYQYNSVYFGSGYQVYYFDLGDGPRQGVCSENCDF